VSIPAQAFSLQHFLYSAFSLDYVFIQVAQQVATRLFQQQSTWDEASLIFQWQMKMPGIGDAYEVSTVMLSGLAIPVENSSSNRQSDKNSNNSSTSAQVVYQYIPVSGLSSDPVSALSQLWKVKDEWTMEQLQPYLHKLELDTGVPCAELLLQHTRTISKQVDGETIKFYTGR
jgi:Sister chromatid cohesion protein Dcc1